MENSEVIILENISKTYNSGDNSVSALANISLTIKKGEFVAIVGTSGSGKSTLMNILGCLDIATKGKYFLEGKDVSKFNDNQLSNIRNEKIGFIFQGFNLVPSLTALENVELPLIYRGIKKEERKKMALDALESVDLSGRVNHLPSMMSGGQQQRVAIARAIAARPPIILADEPTGNLDSASGKIVMETLHMLNEKGKTIVLITHDMDIASKAQRVIRVSDGRIKEQP